MLEQIACGQMGLNVDYFYSLTPRQFQNIQIGWNHKRDAEMNMQMILTRRIMWSNLAPYSKGLTEQGLWPLYFEEDHLKEFSEEEFEKQLAELEESKKRWEKIDAARQNKKENTP